MKGPSQTAQPRPDVHRRPPPRRWRPEHHRPVHIPATYGAPAPECTERTGPAQPRRPSPHTSGAGRESEWDVHPAESCWLAIGLAVPVDIMDAASGSAMNLSTHRAEEARSSVSKVKTRLLVASPATTAVNSRQLRAPYFSRIALPLRARSRYSSKRSGLTVKLVIPTTAICNTPRGKSTLRTIGLVGLPGNEETIKDGCDFSKDRQSSSGPPTYEMPRHHRRQQGMGHRASLAVAFTARGRKSHRGMEVRAARSLHADILIAFS